MSIITVQEFTELRKVSGKIDQRKIQEAIDLAEESDFVDMLGGFYFDVKKNKELQEWSLLFNGGDFVYCGEDYTHKGLKAVLADLTYSRYSYTKNINDTPFGLVVKSSNDSNPIDRSTMKDLSSQAQKDAYSKFRFVEYYILSEPVLFERYMKEKMKGTSGSFNTSKFSRL